MDKEDKIIHLLEEILTWTKLGMYSSVKDLILDEFNDSRPEKRLAFELLNGDRSQSEIVEICRNEFKDAQISTSSLSNWVNSWEKVGLIQKDGYSVAKNFSLIDFGFNDSILKKY